MRPDFSNKKKKKNGRNLGPTGLNKVLNEDFCHFIEFGSNVSLEIATSSRNKTHEKNYGDGKVDKFGPNGPKSSRN